MGPNSLVNFGNNSSRFWGLASGSLLPTILNLMVGKRSSIRIETLRTYVSHRQDNWDECLRYFEFAYNQSVNPSTGMSPFILSYAQSPRTPWQFLDTYVDLDELVPVDASEAQKGSGAQLASSLVLDIINNVREARDTLHRMDDDFRLRNARLSKPHTYNVGDSVLLSTKNVNLNLPCKELSPAFVGPFTSKLSSVPTRYS
jgi:hypothetical protein